MTPTRSCTMNSFRHPLFRNPFRRKDWHIVSLRYRKRFKHIITRRPLYNVTLQPTLTPLDINRLHNSHIHYILYAMLCSNSFTLVLASLLLVFSLLVIIIVTYVYIVMSKYRRLATGSATLLEEEQSTHHELQRAARQTPSVLHHTIPSFTRRGDNVHR